MRRRRLLALWIVALLSGSACAPSSSKQPREVPMPSDSPFELRLEAGKGPKLSARLVNRSGAARPVLHDMRLQPSRLVLMAADGVEVEPFDRRALMKYDPRIYCNLFQSLAAGREISFGEARFERKDGRWSVNWGPYEFDALAAGTYSAHLSWTSDAAACQETAESESTAVSDVWLGTVESNTVEVVLR